MGVWWTGPVRTEDPHHWRRLWLVLFAVAYGTNVPTPLLLAYQDRLDLSAVVVTGLFGIYAAGLVPALLLGGPASDRLGRRPVVVPFVWLAVIASAVFLPASEPLLYLGRFLQGAVSGVVFSVGSAWLAELSRGADAGRAARRATVAMTVGFGLGPLVSGLLAQFAPAPLLLPYLVHFAWMAVGLAALVGIPETVAERRRGPVLDLGVPAGARRAFAFFVLPAGLFTFAMPSLAATVFPIVLQDVMAGLALAVTGVVAGVTMTFGVLVQPLGERVGADRAAPAGLLSGAVGLAVGVVTVVTGVWGLLAVVSLLLGFAYGLLLQAGLTAVEWITDPATRGALTSSYYAVAYSGFASPVVVSTVAARTGFALPLSLLAALAAAAAAWTVWGGGRRALIARRDARLTAG